MNNYFSHDSNARNDEKIVRLRMKHKAAGYGIYFMILERMRDENKYMCTRDYDMIAFDLREDAELIRSVVEDFGLFTMTEDGKSFYSESFMRRMKGKDDLREKRSQAGKSGAGSRWQTEEETMANATETDGKRMANATETNGKRMANATKTNGKPMAKTEKTYEDVMANAIKNDGNKSKVKERKVKESKEKKRKEKCVGETPAPAHAGELSFEDFKEWLEVNAPELLTMKAPTMKSWREIKILYGTREALEQACQEIAANETFRPKWNYIAIALKKWHELGEKLGVTKKTVRSTQNAAEEREQERQRRETEWAEQQAKAVSYEEYKRMLDEGVIS